MAVRLKQKNFKLSGAITGALAVGGALLLLRTYPHIKAVFKFDSSESNNDIEEDNTPVPVDGDSDAKNSQEFAHNSTAMENVQDLSDNSIKSILLEKNINPPPNATHDELVSILRLSQ